MQFSVVASFTGNLAWEAEHYCPCDTVLTDALRAWKDATGEDAEPSEPGDSEYDYLAEETGERGTPAEDFFAALQDVQVSGILTRDQFETFVDGVGAYAEDCETMGTLGGPLAPWGGVVSDISFRCESQYMIESIRVTPVPNRDWKPDQWGAHKAARAEAIWNRLRSAILRQYGC